MEFNDLPKKLQQKFLDIFKEHLDAVKKILDQDGCLEPMLHISSQSESQLISLQPQDGIIDEDKLLEKAIEIVKCQSFDTALLSYSSSSILKKSQALVTYIFDKSGTAVLYFTAYSYKGLFKKKVVLEKHILGGTFNI